MQEYIRKLTIRLFILFFFQILIFGGLFVCIQLKFVEQYIADITLLVAAVFILMDIVALYIYLAKMSNARQKTDIKAIDIVGSDLQEAYTFGRIGIVVTDDRQHIIWTNELFSDLQASLIDKDIFEWKPELINCLHPVTKQNPCKIKIHNQLYEVKYLPDAHLFFFKDVTDYEAVLQFSRDQSPAIGMIAIDNYVDIAAILDDLTINDMLSMIQKTIANYAKKYNLLVKKYRSDGYIIIGNRKSYEAMLEDKFSIVKKVREEVEMGENELTLSIGFAVGFDDVVKLSEMANAALDVALSRGGDQVVISPYGENFIFLGGKSEAKTKRNRVKIRVLSQSLVALMRDASNVYIMGHIDMDLDALGSALGLYSMAVRAGAKTKIVYDERLTETKTKKAFKQMFQKEEIASMVASPSRAVEEMNEKSLVILTDVHRPSICLSKDIIEKAERVAVVDHHRRAEEFVEKPVFVHIEPSASSASELVAELIRYNEIRLELPSRIATMMLGGILLDTNYYRSKTGARTYDASLILKEYGADNQQADEFLKEEYEEYALKTKIMSNSTTPYYGVIISLADDNDFIDRSILSSVAQDTLSIKGVNACFVIGRTGEKEVRISSRSDGTINCQLLMEKLKGGGHYTSAAASFQDRNIEQVYTELRGILDSYLNDARIEMKN